ADGGYAPRLLLDHVEAEEHEWRDKTGRPGAAEPFAGALLHHRPRHRPEVLPVLDLVEPGLHVRMARRGEDRTGPQCARPELHASLEPADDPIPGKRRGGLLGDVAQAPVGQLAPPEEVFDLVVIE